MAQSFSTEFTRMQGALSTFSLALGQFSMDVNDDVADAMKKALKEIDDLEKKLKECV